MSLADAGVLFVEHRDRGALAAIDPRLRLAAALGFLLALSLLRSPSALAAALALAIGTALLARLPLVVTLRRLAAVEAFLLVLLATLPFTVDGTPLFTLFGMAASLDGVRRAGEIVIRVNAGLLLVAALLSTLGGAGLAQAMAGLGVPPRLVLMLQLTLRYVALFRAEYGRLRRAMRARGFRARATPHGWRTLGTLLGMLLLRSVERAERVVWAMKCRGFAGRYPTPERVTPGRGDRGFALLTAVAILALLGLEILA